MSALWHLSGFVFSITFISVTRWACLWVSHLRTNTHFLSFCIISLWLKKQFAESKPNSCFHQGGGQTGETTFTSACSRWRHGPKHCALSIIALLEWKKESSLPLRPSFSLFRAAPAHIYSALGASSFDITAQSHILPPFFFFPPSIRHIIFQCLPFCHLPVVSLPPFAPDLGSTAGLNDSSNPSLLDLKGGLGRTSSPATAGHTAASAERRLNKCDFRVLSCGEKFIVT